MNTKDDSCHNKLSYWDSPVFRTNRQLLSNTKRTNRARHITGVNDTGLDTSDHIDSPSNKMLKPNNQQNNK